MISFLKRFASLLPLAMQEAIQRQYYRLLIRLGKFDHNEPEYLTLSDWVSPGDTVIDVGANIGIFTTKLAELVGERGHVFAFEPVPRTFGILCSNCRASGNANITLLNAAASDVSNIIELSIPDFDSGLIAYTRASINTNVRGTNDQRQLSVKSYSLPIDSIAIPSKVSFVKIDVEGHEISVLRGMKDLLVRDKPSIVSEGGDEEIKEFLRQLGYQSSQLEGSPNTVFTPTNKS